MPLRPPQPPPQDQRQWDQWARTVAVVPDNNSVTTVTVADKAITNAKLRDSVPASVIGRLQTTPGMPGDIPASADNTFLVRRAGLLVFGVLADADIPATLARDAEVTAAITAFNALPDPFTQYYNQTRGDARYAQLPLIGSTTYDPPSLADGAGVTTTVTCVGALLGWFAQAAFSLDLQGILLTAWVSITDTVSVRWQNESGGTLDLPSGTLKVRASP